MRNSCSSEEHNLLGCRRAGRRRGGRACCGHRRLSPFQTPLFQLGTTPSDSFCTNLQKAASVRHYESSLCSALNPAGPPRRQESPGPPDLGPHLRLSSTRPCRLPWAWALLPPPWLHLLFQLFFGLFSSSQPLNAGAPQGPDGNLWGDPNQPEGLKDPTSAPGPNLLLNTAAALTLRNLAVGWVVSTSIHVQRPEPKGARTAPAPESLPCAALPTMTEVTAYHVQIRSGRHCAFVLVSCPLSEAFVLGMPP